MATQLVDYSDLDHISVTSECVEENMSYYLAKSGQQFVKYENQLWEIDLDSDCLGLYRQNAMTWYNEMTPYLIQAVSLSKNNVLFYLVKCKDYPTGWIQVDKETGDNIYNIRS